MTTLRFAVIIILLTGSIRAQETNPPATTLPSPPSLTSLTYRGTNSEPTEITSDKLRVDYGKNVGTFTGNVLVVDPRLTVRADQMVVFFTTNTPPSATTNKTSKAAHTNGTAGVTATNATPRIPKTPGTTDIGGNRSLEKIIADGGVVITQERRKATSDHAEYYADEGKVILTGSPKVQTPNGNITGYIITFWNNTEQMEVIANPAETNRTRLVIYPEDVRKNKDAPAILPEPAKP